MSNPQAVNVAHHKTIVVTSIRARNSWPWRLAAVVAVSTQIVSAICGVLLLIYWVVASITLTE